MTPVADLTTTTKRPHSTYQHSHSNFLEQWIKESQLTWRAVGLGGQDNDGEICFLHN